MASGAAEDVGVDAFFVLVVLLIDAGFEGDEAVGLVLVESRVDGASLGDELVKLEGEDGVAGPFVHQ